MNIGDIVNKDNYTAYAIWCNKNNAHIEKRDKQYIVVANEDVEPKPTEPTLEERVVALEAENEALNDTVLALVEMLDTVSV